MRTSIRWFAFVGSVTLLGLGSSAIACQEMDSPSVEEDASFDQSAPACVTDKDCTGGGSCSYPGQLVGCAAKGSCRVWDSPDASSCTTPATTACGCDGKTVQIPPCWNGFAPAPVLATGQLTCEGGS